MIKIKGFTLIELMSVAAIIGILAAMALPLYQSYTARSKVSEVLTMLSKYKVSMSECLAAKGNSAECRDSGSGISEVEVANTSIYISSVVIAEPNDSLSTTGQALFSVILDWGSIGANGVGNLTFSAANCAGSVKWACGLSELSDSRFMPKTCQQTTDEALLSIAC